MDNEVSESPYRILARERSHEDARQTVATNRMLVQSLVVINGGAATVALASYGAHNAPARVSPRLFLQAAIENEVIDYIQFHKDRRDENGQRLVVRNGHLPEREVVSGVGPIRVRQPRVRHRDQGRFTSAILPRFMRRTPRNRQR